MSHPPLDERIAALEQANCRTGKRVAKRDLLPRPTGPNGRIIRPWSSICRIHEICMNSETSTLEQSRWSASGARSAALVRHRPCVEFRRARSSRRRPHRLGAHAAVHPHARGLPVGVRGGREPRRHHRVRGAVLHPHVRHHRFLSPLFLAQVVQDLARRRSSCSACSAPRPCSADPSGGRRIIAITTSIPTRRKTPTRPSSTASCAPT